MLAAFLLVALGAVFYVVRHPVGDDSLQQARDRGVLRVGYSVAPPFISIDADGVPRGTAVQDIPAIAAALGISRIEWVQTSYAKLIPDLLDRRYDMAAGQLKTPSRAAKVRFSAPVARVSYGLLVRPGNPLGLASFAKLAPVPGLKVAVIRDSVSDELLRARGFGDDQLVPVSEGDSGEAALRTGAAQALVRTLPSLQVILAERPGQFELIEDPVADDVANLEVGYIFHPDDAALLKAWNAAMPRPATPAGAP